MYAACKQLFITLLLVTVWHATYASYNVTKYCTMIKPGTKLASTDSCSQYFVCTSATGKYDTSDCGSGYSFDKDKQNCQASTSVDCFYGVENACAGKNNTFVPDLSQCGGWQYCKNGTVNNKGTCDKGQVFSGGQCIFGKCPDEEATPEEAEPVSVCDIMPNNKWFGDTLDCPNYNQCKAGAPLTTAACTNSLVYDVQRELCNYKSSTDCSRITGEALPGPGVELPCIAADLNKKQANPTICSNYLLCDGQFWVSTSCGTGKFWDEAGAECVARQKATPVATCDRCEGSTAGFVNTVDPTCKGYAVCKNGTKTGTGTCSGYFDEDTNSCLNALPGDYAATHGACKASSGGTCVCGDIDSTSKLCVDGTGCTCGFDVDGTTCIECTADATGNCPAACDCESLTTCTDAGDGCLCAPNSAVPPVCVSCVPAVGTITGGVCVEPIPCDCTLTGDICEDTNGVCTCGLEETGATCVDCATDVCAPCVCKTISTGCTNAGTDSSACVCGLDGTNCIECDLSTTVPTECAVQSFFYQMKFSN